jgi:nucleotide-binding universal stress UspA family protein
VLTCRSRAATRAATFDQQGGGKSLSTSRKERAVVYKILVPLDGSELAERALIYATSVARPGTVRLVLVRVAMSHTLAGVDGQERRVGAIHEAEQYLSRVRADIAERGFEVDCVVPYGHAAECIADQARLQEADLIVMSTHGRTGPARLLFGSVAESVITRTSVPVLLERAWHPQVREPRADRGKSLTVLLDGSAFAEAALDPAVRLALSMRTRLEIVRIALGHEQINEASSYLDGIRERLTLDYPDLRSATNVRFGETAASELERLLAEAPPTMVVMATHGRTGVRRALIGSVAGHVLRHATSPLVLVRPPLPEDAVTGSMAATATMTLTR